PITLEPGHLTVEDPDDNYPTGFTLSVLPGENYTVSGSTVTPASDFFGDLIVPVPVIDGTFSSNAFNVTVAVIAVNDPPVITGQVPATTESGSPFTLELSHLTVTDVDNAYPAGFTLSVAPGAQYTVSGTTVTPAADFEGTLFVSVTVSDGQASSAPFNFQIQVAAGSAIPVIIGQQPLTTQEDQAITIALSHLVVEDADNTYPNW